MKINKKLFVSLLLAVVSFIAVTAKADDVVWFDGIHAVSYHIASKTDPVVKFVADMFADDMLAVTGQKAVATNKKNATIQIVELDRLSKNESKRLFTLGIPVDELQEKTDGFYISVVEGKIIIVGSNGRGCAYGLLELSRKAGVSPWIWWGDITPERRTKLIMEETFKTLQGASVEYRGIFINDEDWSIRPWSYLNNDPASFGVIGAKTYRRIFQLLLRLRANAFWPAMHEQTKPFFLVPGAKELADSCSMVVGSSHSEALLRNNVGEWDFIQRGDYNYITNRSAVQAYWAERLQEIKEMQGGSMLTIGMRGLHDGTMSGVKTMEEKQTALQQVIDDQQQLINKYLEKKNNYSQIFIPYKEVLDIYRQGLKVPDRATLMWCDDNYGYLTRLSDSSEQMRSGGGGVYYHLSYWGQPHDYLWLTTTQPGLVYNEMRTAYDHNVKKVWIVNVHDPKVAGYDLELFLDMAWNINCVSESTLEQHYKAWLSRQFGKRMGVALLPIMKDFYRLCAQRRPEFMGWNECENYSDLHDNGLSPVRNTQFSEQAFGNELDRYLEEYATIAEKVRNLAVDVRPELKDAYFAAIEYPVCVAEAHARKMLWAQKARSFVAHYPLDAWQDSTDYLYHAVAESQYAYQQIRQLTDRYNKNMSNGKWNHSMSLHPRDLPVFAAPVLPLQLTDSEVDKWLGKKSERTKNHPVDLDNTIVFNASDYEKASAEVKMIQMLGHSMKAVSIPQNETVEYSFKTSCDSSAVLRMDLIPTQPNDDGDLRFSVSVDNATPVVFSLKEPFRSARWKQNVLRQQAVRTLELPQLKKGEHQIIIKALDPHIILDQLMIDFNPQRNFYLFPTKAEEVLSDK